MGTLFSFSNWSQRRGDVRDDYYAYKPDSIELLRASILDAFAEILLHAIEEVQIVKIGSIEINTVTPAAAAIWKK